MAAPTRTNNFLVLTAEPEPPRRRSSTFLSLAPDTSSSWPQMPVSRGSVSSTDGAQPEPRRRISSVSSGSRVLKLGPVHWGEHLDEHKEDFHEISQ
ncbi:unnamed protein product [Clonostachys rosea]|uniref:Uncharacterized protein n=1 Tax=Bionectria ochroleuca TaxID=29856 RepID=A0ABY6TUU8_BIOOC|nr:unnamed protein product [Clonostachys rosea]